MCCFPFKKKNASRAARKNERAWGARPDGRRASRFALSVARFIALSILV